MKKKKILKNQTLMEKHLEVMLHRNCKKKMSEMKLIRSKKKKLEM